MPRCLQIEKTADNNFYDFMYLLCPGVLSNWTLPSALSILGLLSHFKIMPALRTMLQNCINDTDEWLKNAGGRNNVPFQQGILYRINVQFAQYCTYNVQYMAFCVQYILYCTVLYNLNCWNGIIQESAYLMEFSSYFRNYLHTYLSK